MEIAIYGKGGIGKSTISANISAGLGKIGKNILQVGCDPKQDSTRLLLNGVLIESVLDYIKRTNPQDYSLKDIVYEGIYGVHCVEAGGPEPGVGCAGRGILTTFELLDKLGIKDKNYDGIIYDVLGDVVCGGFAVPIRKEYAKKIYVVTSGEFMSIYAANNILRGVKNYDDGTNRLGGIIYNARGLEDEDGRLERFSQAVKLPIVAKIPRSELFGISEREKKCVVEKYPDSDIAKIFYDLSNLIISQENLYEAQPIDTNLLEEKVLLTEKSSKINVKKAFEEEDHKEDKKEKKKIQIYSKNVIHKEPLHGCAYSGAAGVTTQIKESATISHGPNSCAHITYQNISSLARKTLLERGITLAIQTSPPFYSSEMDENVMIFGGIDNLLNKVKEIKKNKPKVIFVLTTCPSGIIGDNVEDVRSLEEEGIRIIPIITDGNITGDYLQGILIAYSEIAKELIDKNVEKEDNLVNIIGEKPVANSTNYNYNFVKDILESLGLSINCRFINNTDYASIVNFKKAGLNLLAYDDYMGRNIRDFLVRDYDVEFFHKPFPVGYDDTISWIYSLCKYFHKEELYNLIIKDYKERYEDEIKKYKENLQGKKVMILCYNQDIDWVLKTIIDLGMSIEYLGLLNFSQEDTFDTKYMDNILEFKDNYDMSNKLEDINKIKPDILLTNYSSPDTGGDYYSDTIPLSPSIGFFSGLAFAKKWSELFTRKLKEGWKADEELFKKYFSR